MPTPYEVIATWHDHANGFSSNTMYIAPGLTIAQIEEGLQGAAILLDDVSTAVLRHLNYAVPVDIAGLTGNVSAGSSDVEEVGEFIFRNDNGDPVNLNVPCINDTTSPVGTDNLDQSDPNIAAIISMMEDGIVTVGGTIQPCDIDQMDIAQVEIARERVRNTGSRG